MWIQVFVNSGVALGQAASPHAGELSVGEQRGGFTGYRLCRRPLQNSMSGWLDDLMSLWALRTTMLNISSWALLGNSRLVFKAELKGF